MEVLVFGMNIMTYLKSTMLKKLITHTINKLCLTSQKSYNRMVILLWAKYKQ
jgi:hypothetical protein